MIKVIRNGTVITMDDSRGLKYEKLDIVINDDTSIMGEEDTCMLDENGIEENTDLIEDETSLLDCEDDTNLLDNEDETSLLGMSEEDEEETSLLGEEKPEDGFSETFTKEFEIIVTHSDTII